MGAWGVSLYSGDFAQDLRASVTAVARLPFDAERLLEYLCATEPTAANNPTDSDHTTFWLTIADQFAKRGIDCARAREKALAIIADGADLAAMAALGMDEKSLVKRKAMLEELRARIAAPADAPPRKLLKSPQKLLLEAGEVLTYPICDGEPINPYTIGKEWERVKAWRQDGWGALVIAECGLAFDYLAWYRPLVICEPFLGEPSLAELREPRMWLLRNPGTLTGRHIATMRMKSLGRIEVDPARLSQFFPERMSPVSCVVSDISMGNNMTVAPLGVHEAHRIKHGYAPTPRINALDDICALP